MNTTENTGINSLSIKERKNISNSMLFKMHLFLFFITTPLAMLQEFFMLPYIINTGTANMSIWQTILTYFQTHYMNYTYLLLIVLTHIAAFIMHIPHHKYLMTGEGLEKMRKETINPTPLILCFLIIPNLCNTVNLILDFKYISSLPFFSIVHFFSFKIIWQMFSGMLTVFYLFRVNKPLRNTLGLYTFPPKQRLIFSVVKDIFILFLQLLCFILVILEIFNLLDRGIANNVLNSYINFVLTWGIFVFFVCVIFANTLLFCQQNINASIKQFIYQNVKSLVNDGNLSLQSTYYEQNALGSFVSEYNKFTDHLKNDIIQINHSIGIIHKENNTLVHNTSELIAALTQQEINVTQMNIATNNTGATVRYLLTEVDKQSQILDDEQENLNNLTEGSNNIRETFNLITEEHRLSQISNDEALAAVQNSLEKTELMNTQIINIHQQIKTAGLETSVIDDLLNIIKNLLEQTNLLSMSAAIEAAHGDTSSRKGFFLVAEEIRKLAQMSQDSVGKVALRLSSIKDYINDAYYISKESINLSSSSIRTSEQLKTSISQVSAAASDLSEITGQAEPITIKQNELILQYQTTVTEMQAFLQHLVKELKTESSSAILMSLNFRSMIKNFKEGRSSLYHIETGVEKLSVIEKNLERLLQEFVVEDTSINKINE